MFPMGMSQLRERVFAALAHLVWIMDNPAERAAYLTQLGRDHRKYGVKDKHYHAFFNALLETAEYFSGVTWNPATAAAWRGALAHAAHAMRTAAEQDARERPPWWVGEVVAHDLRSETVAVLRIRPDQPLPYLPGQYLPVQVTRWPRVWRPYSVANAPRPDGLIDLHVRAVPGGMVSTALVRHTVVGDTLLLGPADGAMTTPRNDRDLLCVAGGTGLAPIKAIIEEIAVGRRPGQPRRITLLVGARRRQDLYDLPDLWALQEACPGLQVIPVVSDEVAGPALTGMTRMLSDVAGGYGLFESSEAIICGPEAMVAKTAFLLAGRVAPDQIHHDPLPASSSYPAESAARASYSRPDPFARFARPDFSHYHGHPSAIVADGCP